MIRKSKVHVHAHVYVMSMSYLCIQYQLRHASLNLSESIRSVSSKYLT